MPRRILSLLLLLLFLPGILTAAGGCQGQSLLYEGRGDLHVEPVEVRLVRITARGLVPAGEEIRLPQGAGSVAFLNDTRDQLASITIPTHAFSVLSCSFTTGFSADGQGTFTTPPLAPGAIATLCLHDAVTVPFEVHGPGDEPFRGKLVVVPPAEKPETGEPE